MPTPTPELGLQQALDGDDTAAYLDTSLANSLVTLDALFNNVSGHTHGGVHQGGPVSSIPITAIPDGSITSAKITDGTIQSVDLSDGSVTTTKLAAGAVTTPAIASGITLTSSTLNTPTLNSPALNNASESSPTISNPTISGTIGGSPTFLGPGPYSNDWFRCSILGDGIYNTAANAGVGFDAGGPFVSGAYGGGHLITETAAQTLTNKTLTSPTINTPTINSPTISGPLTTGVISATGYLNFTANANQITWPSGEYITAGEPTYPATVMLNTHARVGFDLNVGHNVTCVQLIQTSDPALKTSTPMTDDDCMLRVRSAVPVVTYTIPPPSGTPLPPYATATNIGFNAPDLYAVAPEFTALDDQSQPVAINYANISALLWGALRQLDARCQAGGI
jgi:hypothetical protein